MLRGNLDIASLAHIEGWVQDEEQPDRAINILITDNDALIGRVLANRYRADLESAGIGNGRHAFEFKLPLGLSPAEPHVIRLRDEVDGSDVPGSPITIEPSQIYDEAVEQSVSRALTLCGTPADLSRKIEFLSRQLVDFVQQLADRDGKRSERSQYRDLMQRWMRRATDARDAPDAEPSPCLRAVAIDDRLPRLDRDAGSNAILSHLRSLQRLGFEITFIPVADFDPPARERAAMATLGVKCACAPFYGSVEEVLRRQSGLFDLVYLHRVGNAAKYEEIARETQPRARCLFSVADLHHVRTGRQATAEDRPEIALIANRLRFLEFTACALADVVVTHSSYEAAVLRKHLKPSKVHTIRWSLHATPTAVPLEQRRGVAFIGGFGHEPNRDAARWLIGEIMPLVRRHDPDIECLLVGSDLPDEIAKLCGNGVVALGHVPDLATIFDRVRLTVAPLGYGAGIKGKVMESMAAGLPCVCTPIAAEGLDLPKALQALVHDDAPGIASAIHRVHSDANLNASCSQAGLAYVGSELSEERLDGLMRQAIGLAAKAT